MLVIENINNLMSGYNPTIFIETISLNDEDETYIFTFRCTRVNGWIFTYVLHRDLDNGKSYVGTLRYSPTGNVHWDSHREDCSKLRLKNKDMFLDFLEVLVIEWKEKNNIT